MATVFLVANLGLAALALGLVRGAAGHFISVYTVDDLALGASLAAPGLALPLVVEPPVSGATPRLFDSLVGGAAFEPGHRRL